MRLVSTRNRDGGAYSFNRPYSGCPLLYMRLGTNGIKAMSRGFLGGKQVTNFSNTRNRGRICLFLTTENEQLFILKTIMANYGCQ